MAKKAAVAANSSPNKYGYGGAIKSEFKPGETSPKVKVPARPTSQTGENAVPGSPKPGGASADRFNEGNQAQMASMDAAMAHDGDPAKQAGASTSERIGA